MEAHEQRIRASANKKGKELIKDTNTYVESVGKHDIGTLGPDGTLGDTALRLVLGGTTDMPYRVLSYVESAARIAMHFPEAQLQIVHACNVAHKVNGIDINQAREAAKSLNPHIARLTKRLPQLEGRIVHGIDSDLDTDSYVDEARHVMEDADRIAQLGTKGRLHGGDTARYLAAHFAFHDTDTLSLEELSGEQVAAKSIISIGCQQERKFYMARMAMRQLVEPTVNTAQVFTKHLTPPYYVARGGEPLLKSTVKPRLIVDIPARRDIEHYERLIRGEHL